VTSAEAVLVTRQTNEILFQNCHGKLGKSSDQKYNIAFTISPASLADLYRTLYGDSNDPNNPNDSNDSNENPRILFQRLGTFLKEQLGMTIFLDATMTNHIAFLESTQEFLHRHEIQKRTPSAPTTPPPSMALSSTETKFILSSDETTTSFTTKHAPGRDIEHHNSPNHNPLPLLSSSCPGFICYVEKTVPHILPHLTTVKSPMAIAGSFLKHTSLFNEEVYHVAIMPCHDKKLEASRKDFTWEYTNKPDVDHVMTTQELYDLMELVVVSKETHTEPNDDTSTKEQIRIYLENLSLATLSCLPPKGDVHPLLLHSSSNASFHPTPTPTLEINHIQSTSNNAIPAIQPPIGSGSHADQMFRTISNQLYDFNIPMTTPLPWTSLSMSSLVQPKKSSKQRLTRRKATKSDILQVILYHNNETDTYTLENGTPILRFAIAYGFKNIQIIMQNLQKLKLDYLEIMACPSGCVNGGGQIKIESNNAPLVQTRERVKFNLKYMDQIRNNSRIGRSHDDKTVFTKWLYRSPKIWKSIHTDNDMQGDSESQGIFGLDAKQMLHTRFYHVPKMELSMGLTAGVTVDAIQW